MDPNDPTLSPTPREPIDSSDAAWDAGLAEAYGPVETGSHHPVADPETGTILTGKYRLTERIGEGGMGSVWVAHQTEPVKRKVAVKLIKAGMDSKSVLARFEAERQALAVMDHPNIAKVLDGGLHDGRPFFVMELVKGVPITEYCDARKLTPNQRLELFVPVCQAIQHAHQKGIIHRDIKPSNVLIAMYDDKPVPKVIDFGIAKATGGTLTEHTIETAFGGVVGTPQYMSPEQASLNNLDIDTRSDVYSLGVLLYELLTGSPPFARKDLEKRGLLEILRVVREDEPPRPSVKLSTADTLPSLSASRGTEPKKLTGLLRNELDWIVMKALEKDRARRYDTANGFAADVNRYLSGEAVQAHPPSTAYRVKKFVRRNKAQVIAASLVLVVLLAGIAGTTAGLIQAEQSRLEAVAAAEREAEERKKADTAKVVAQAKEAEANAVVKFFEDKVFAAARPKGQEDGLGTDVTLRDAIALSIPALEKEFEKQPLVEARLRLAVGVTFEYLGEHDQARGQFERGWALLSRHRGPDDPATVTSMTNLASSYAALDRHADAVKLREETLAIQQRTLPKDDPDTLASMVNLAMSYAALNRHADAAKLFEESLATQKRVLPKDHPATLRSMINLAKYYTDRNRPAEAIKLGEEVLEIQMRVLPKDHPDMLSCMNNLANSYADLNRHADALKLREEVLAIKKLVLPKDHPAVLMGMHNLANSYAALSRHADALKLRTEVVAIKKRVLPKDHRETLRSMNALANSYAALHQQEEALKLREETLAIQKRVLPKDDPDTLVSLSNLALSYSDRNRHEEARKLFEETLAIRKRVLPKDHPATLRSMINLADSLIQLGQGSESLALVEEFVAKSPTNPAIDPKLIPRAFGLRLTHFQKTSDSVGCRANAESWEKLNRTDAGSLYTAACFRAVTAAVQAKAKTPDAAKLAQDDADRAMEWLTKAVQAGYKDADHLKKDADLDSLRERGDFKKLIVELEKMAEKK